MSALVPENEDPDGLKPRQEVILRTVIEEHISTGVPVGSKNIAGREGIDFASSTVRYELARLEELGFLDHPHTSAGRVPTDRGYRYYVDTLLTRDPPAQPPAMLEGVLDVAEMRREVDAALGRLADVVSQVTNLLGIVTAPPPETSTVRHVEVLLLQPQVVMVVVITSTGAVTKRVFAFEGPVDPGLCEWAGAFLNDQVAGLAVGARMVASRLADPSLGTKESAFLEALSPALVGLDEGAAGSIFVGGPGALPGRAAPPRPPGDRRADGDAGGALPAPGLPARRAQPQRGLPAHRLGAARRRPDRPQHGRRELRRAAP